MKFGDRDILEMMWKQLMDNKATLSSFIDKVDRIQKNVQEMQTTVVDLENGLSHIEHDVEVLKEAVESLKECSKKKDEVIKNNQMEIIDLSNHSRRNNVIIYNIPEGEEDETGCLDFATKFLKNEVGLDPQPELEAAHRSGKTSANIHKNQTERVSGIDPKKKIEAHPTHVRVMRRPDKDLILDTAIKKLKGKECYITDDVHPLTRNVHRKLVVKMKEIGLKDVSLIYHRVYQE